MITVAMSITKKQFELLTSAILEGKVLRDLVNDIARTAKQTIGTLEREYGLRLARQKDKSGYGIVGFGERYTKLYKNMVANLGSNRAADNCINKRTGQTAGELVQTGMSKHFAAKKRESDH